MHTIRPHSIGPSVLGALLLIAVEFAHVHPVVATDPEALHEQAWSDVLDSSTPLSAASFGIYAYRSAAVQHPEVYLQADALISETLEDLPGSRLAYRSTDVRDVELYLRLARRETKGGAFGWAMLSLNPDSIFDAKSDSPRSAIEWAGMRLPSVAVLLKSTSPRLSTVESSLLRYSQLARTQRATEGVFVVIDRDGAGYLATDSTLWLAGMQTRGVADWKSISPALVFSRRSAFSILTGRDDRNNDSLLAVILGRLDSPKKLSLNQEDRDLLSRISRATTLPDTTALRLSVLVSSGLIDRRQPRVETAWSELVEGDSVASRCAPLLLRESYYWGNRLCSATAALASEYANHPIDEAMKQVEQRYLSLAGRRVSRSDSADFRREAWGCLWSYDLLETVIIDNIRTRAGSSSSQASAMSAILDLAGIDHFQLGLQMSDKQIPDQQWLFADSGRFQYNFGVWTVIPEVVAEGPRKLTLVITGFSLRGKSVEFERGALCACIDGLAIGEHLTRFARRFPNANFALFDPTGEVVPLQKFLGDLAGDRYETVCPSWPR